MIAWVYSCLVTGSCCHFSTEHLRTALASFRLGEGQLRLTRGPKQKKACVIHYQTKKPTRKTTRPINTRGANALDNSTIMTPQSSVCVQYALLTRSILLLVDVMRSNIFLIESSNMHHSKVWMTPREWDSGRLCFRGSSEFHQHHHSKNNMCTYICIWTGEPIFLHLVSWGQCIKYIIVRGTGQTLYENEWYTFALPNGGMQVP